MSTLLQLSDTHFGTEQPPVMEALLALAWQLRPELVVLSGDITQRARAAQFQAARAFCDRLKAPVLAVPGNHDLPLFALWLRLHQPYANYVAAFGPNLEPVHCTADLMVVGVNTTRVLRHKNGEVSPAQVGRVADVLQGARACQLRVVVVHQPVAVTRAQDLHNRLRGREAALRCWAEAGADLIMGGHIHLPYVVALPDLARPMWAVQAGTAVSSRLRPGAPNSVNVLHWGEGRPAGRCEIEQWDFCRNRRAFVRVHVQAVHPARLTRW